MKTKNPRLWFALVLFAALHFCRCPAFAQGTAFTYQGQLTAGGQPCNGSFDMEFSLYNADTNGTQVGSTVTSLAVGVTNGLFTAAVDFGVSPYNGQPLWLQVAVSPAGSDTFTTLFPLQPLTSTPYAVQSLNAGTAANLTGAIQLSQLPGEVVTNGATNVSITGTFSGNGGTLTNVPGTLAWQLTSNTNFVAASSQAYLITNNAPTILTLPPLPNIGDIVTVRGASSNQWTVYPNVAQTILGCPASPGPGTFWQIPNTDALTWVSIASSADGSKLVASSSAYIGAGGNPPPTNAIFTSSNGGLTWTQASVANYNWGQAASSYDGTHLFVGVQNGPVSFAASSDSGATWYDPSIYSTNLGGSFDAFAIACSSDGSKLVAVCATGISNRVSTSIDSGTNWTSQLTRPSGARFYDSAASSADGSKLAVVIGGAVMTSSNFGTNWAVQAPGGSSYFAAMASSADGTKLVAVPYTGQIYTSTNSGTNWTAQNSGTQSWQCVASSADGTKLIAAGANTQIYTSVDSGITWTPQISPMANWTAAAISADGTKWAAGVYGGSIYVASATALYGSGNQTVQFLYTGAGNWQVLGLVAAGGVTNQESGVTLAGAFSGDGSGLTNLSASALPASVVMNNETGVILGGTFSGTFSGNGTGLTNLNASALPGIVVTNTETGVTLGGTFNGNGSGLTNLSVSALPSVVVTNLKTGVTLSGTFSGNGSGLTNVALLSGGNSFTGNQFVSGGNIAINVANPGANTLQINTNYESASGYALEANSPQFGANIQIDQPAGGGGIGLVVDNAANGDTNTHLLWLRNNAGATPQTVFDVRTGTAVTINVAYPLQVGTAYCTGSMWQNNSDRNKKKDFAPISPQDILEQLAALPITQWRYTNETQGFHLGPMAQDFMAAFHLGTDAKSIGTSDEGGVALAAIQGLNQKVQAENAKLSDELHAVRAENDELKARLNRLEKLITTRQIDPISASH